ncbi:MAG: hypothetical protein ACI8UR_001883, partial [Natronomonas sp.]
RNGDGDREYPRQVNHCVTPMSIDPTHLIDSEAAVSRLRLNY